MIIYNIRAMTNSQYNELVEITNIHNKIVRENFGTQYPNMKKICDILEIIITLKEEDNLYAEKKDNAIEETDIEKVK